MHNYMKELIKLLFYRINRILTVIRDRMLPENRFLVKDYRSPFKMYEKEQLENPGDEGSENCSNAHAISRGDHRDDKNDCHK